MMMCDSQDLDPKWPQLQRSLRRVPTIRATVATTTLTVLVLNPKGSSETGCCGADLRVFNDSDKFDLK